MCTYLHMYICTYIMGSHSCQQSKQDNIYTSVYIFIFIIHLNTHTRKCMHTHTYILIYDIHTCKHTDIHTYIFMQFTPVYIHIHTYTHRNKHTHTCIHIYMYTDARDPLRHGPFRNRTISSVRFMSA